MTSKGTIQHLQKSNKSYVQPDVHFEFIDSLLSAINHADSECTGELSISDKIIVHILPSNQEFKEDIIKNLLTQAKVLKTKIVFSSSLAISKRISFSIYFDN